MKRFWITLIFVVLMFSLCTLTVSAAGNSKKNASEVKTDNQISYGTISKEGVNDWYYIKTDEIEKYYFFTLHNENGTGNIRMIVYSSRDEKLLDVGDWTSAGSEVTDSIKLQPNATYYLKVFFNGDGTGNYYFKVDKKIDSVGDSKEEAEEIKINSDIESSIDGHGDVDYFVFKTGAPSQKYKVTLTNISGTSNANASIYTTRDEKLADVGFLTYAGQSDSGTVTLDADTTYYLAVQLLNGGGSGNYSFRISQCADGHTPSDTWVTTKEPTCTELGEKTQFCSICNEALKTEQIDAKGHTSGEWAMLKEPTCTEEGQREEICSVCGKSMGIEAVPAYGHTYGDWKVEKEPTCTETGYRYAECDRCHENVQEVIDMIPHVFGEWEIVSGSKLIPPIVKEQKCERCGYVNSEKDWSYIWITILAGVAVVGAAIGVINYAKAFKSRY